MCYLFYIHVPVILSWNYGNWHYLKLKKNHSSNPGQNPEKLHLAVFICFNQCQPTNGYQFAMKGIMKQRYHSDQKHWSSISINPSDTRMPIRYFSGYRSAGICLAKRNINLYFAWGCMGHCASREVTRPIIAVNSVFFICKHSSHV
jgi:hypothetical protein